MAKLRVDTIPKGKHHPNFWWIPDFCWNVKAIEISVYIDPTMCSGSKNHINKICGFSRGKHHDNSVRLGWSNNGSTVGLWEYSYINGERIKRHLGYVYPGGWHKFTLSIKDAHKLPKWGFILNPYHGGNDPHERAVTDVRVKYRYRLIK